MTARSLGLDFGTTNTVLAWAHPHHSFRSALCFRDDGDEHQPHVVTEAATIGLREDIDSWIVKPQAATS
jgi:molecular chaperone DnaK (HSP70)